MRPDDLRDLHRHVAAFAEMTDPAGDAAYVHAVRAKEAWASAEALARVIRLSWINHLLSGEPPGDPFRAWDPETRAGLLRLASSTRRIEATWKAGGHAIVGDADHRGMTWARDRLKAKIDDQSRPKKEIGAPGRVAGRVVAERGQVAVCEGGTAIVWGKPKRLTSEATKVIVGIIRAGDAGIMATNLPAATGVPSARNILAKLRRETDGLWRGVIASPGGKRGIGWTIRGGDA